MRKLVFAQRCIKEIVRDPINLAFGLGFPIVLLLLLSVIQVNAPIEIFNIETLTPGITVFGLSFVTLFSATLVAKDREDSFLQRLYTTPLTASDYICGYMLPLVPIAIMQCCVCYFVGFLLGLQLTINVVLAVVSMIPVSIFYISLGLLCGSVCNVKQVGGLCGALFTNLSAWLSGVWFELDLLGGMFRKIANVLPFVHAVDLERAVISGNYTELWHAWPILGYAAASTSFAIYLFLRQMKRQ